MTPPPIHVLAVDDEPEVAALTKEFLETTDDMVVDTVTSALEARRALTAGRYEAIVSDYQMPVEDGLQFLKWLRASGDRTPFILFTGRGREEIVIEAIDNGADSYIQKGGAPQALYTELAHKVRNAVARRRAERSLLTSIGDLQEAASRYQALIAASNTGAWEYHDDTGYLWCSPEYFSMLGRDIDDYDFSGARNIEETWGVLLHPEDKERANRRFEEYLKHPVGMYEQYFRLRHRNGSWVWIWSRGKVLVEADGKRTSMTVGTHIDITERKMVEERLRQSENRYRVLVDHSPLAVFVNRNDRVALVNQACLRLFGASDPEQLLGRSIYELFQTDHHDGIRQRIEMLRAEGEVVPTVEERIRCLDGRTIDVEVSAVPFQDQGEDAIHVVLRDITERKRSEAALREANKKFNLISSITMHDINNQILVLEGYLAMLVKKHPDLSKDDLMRRSEIAAEQISAIIQFTRNYEDIGVKAPTWQSVRDIVMAAAADLHLAPVQLLNQVPADVEVFADQLIVKVFRNLIDNALQHGKHLSQIWISFQVSDDTAVLVCEDDGDGIAPDMKDLLFTRGHGKNHGLGLFLSKEILAITGITIAEEGQAGRGARFVMVVPAGGTRVRRRAGHAAER